MADYATVAEIKEALADAMSASETTYDALLGKLTTRASRLIDKISGRGDNAFYATSSSARRFAGNNQSTIHIDECVSVSSVETTIDNGTNWTSWAAGTWDLLPYSVSPFWALGASPLTGIGYFPKGDGTVRVTGVWGYSSSVPEVIKQAAIIQSVRWFKRGQSAFGDAFANQDLGGLVFIKGVDPDIQTIIFDGGLRRVTL